MARPESNPESDRKPGRPQILVLGLGNYILMDDGVGVHALRHFAEIAPRCCLAVEVGTAMLSAVHLLEEAEKVIAFDAMVAGGDPGTIYALNADDVLNEGVQDSLHELGLAWILQNMRARRPEVIVIAAEPKVIDYGMELSAPLKAACPLMVEAALAIVSRWQNLDASEDRMSPEDISAALTPLALPAELEPRANTHTSASRK